uniref:Glycosyltransferase-like protein LARGE2 n=1 Tax=Chlamydomonas euryale TaxID=1486919 RepID=A0A7R9VDG8_9CHLO
MRRRGGAADFEPDAELSEAVATVAAWFDAAMARAAAGGPAGSVGGCTPRVLLIYEVFDSDKAAGLLYPVNSLRNLARLMADTPLVASIDVDMLPSASLSAALTDGSHVAALEASCTGKERRVYVLPAFETSCGGPSAADRNALLPKDQLRSVVSEGCLTQFRPKAPLCHNATDYSRWFDARDAYPVYYVREFEPWFIGGRHSLQWFDFRYRGYGKNKISMVAAVAASGSPFYVHPTGFLVHRQHTESNSRKAFLRVKFKHQRDSSMLEGSLYQHIEALWVSTQADLQAGRTEPALEPAVTRCLGALPWWQGQQ